MSEAVQKAQSKAVVPAMSAELVKAEEHRSDLQLAIEKGMDPATIGKLMDLQERWEANQAKKAFVVAMSRFKAECPAVIAKDRGADFGQTSSGRAGAKYNYATTGAIVKAITPILSKCGLSISWETSQAIKLVTVTCHVTHSAGHRESATLTGPHDESGGKNPIQTIGSSVHYLQRYTMVSVLGLATADMDDPDEQPPPVTMPVEKPAAARLEAAAAPIPPPAESSQRSQPAATTTKPESSSTPTPTPATPTDNLSGLGPVVAGPVAHVTQSHDAKNTPPKWHKVTVEVNGEKYGSFDTPIMDRLLKLKENQPVELEYAVDAKGYRNIVSIIEPQG